MSLPLLWACGALGEALSIEVTITLAVALSLLALAIPAARLEATLKILLFISSTAVTICVADTTLRVFGGRIIYYRAHSELLRKDIRHPELSHYVPNARSERSSFGDLAAMSGDPPHRLYRPEVFETDARGFRNVITNQREPFDLLILGDSFGMGLGSSQEETWTTLLTKNGRSLYNLSMPATCPAHGAARLALEVSSLPLAERATIVVPVYVGNDLEECDTETYHKLSEPPASVTRAILTALNDYRSRSPVRQFGMRLVYRWVFADPVITARELPDGRAMLFYKPHARTAQMSAGKVEHSSNFKVLTDSLRQIATIAEHHHASVLVIILPTKEEVYGWMLRKESPDTAPRQSSGLAQALISFCAEQNISCVDLTPQFMESALVEFKKGGLLWWPDDSHWNREGHKVAETLISQALEPR
jgi:hypothetical protein